MKFRHSTPKILASRRLRQNALEFKANLGHIPRLYLKRKQRRKKRKTKKQKGARNKLETQTIIFPSFFSETIWRLVIILPHRSNRIRT